MATYVISDLHGHYDIFEHLLKKVNFSDQDRLYMLGDAIDRGPDGIKILQRVMNTPNMRFLIGNHEFMMLNSVPEDGSMPEDIEMIMGRSAVNWLFNNGGIITCKKYAELKRSERQILLEWLRNCLLTTVVHINDTDFCLTHTCFAKKLIDVPYKFHEYRQANNIVWNTPYRRDVWADPAMYYEMKPWKFIIGHVPVYRISSDNNDLTPYIDDNIIDIDGGCASGCCDHEKNIIKGGILLRLDDMQHFSCSFDDLLT